MAGVGLTLSACAGDDTFQVTEGFYGATAAEEPRAALIARDVLVNGGSAADAAVAMYFALAVTLPSSAGLNANGACLMFQPATGRVVSPFSTDRSGPEGFKNPPYEVLSFPPTPAAASGGTVAIPLGPRAMFALHAKYGRLNFETLIAQAERLARFGAPVSRALATDLASSSAAFAGDDAASRIFLRNGRTLGQEEGFAQLDLAATLGRLRGEGVGSLYNGPLANSYIEAARLAGYQADPARLRAALPTISTVDGVIHDDHIWAIVGANPVDTALGQVTLDLILDGADWSSDRGKAQATLARALIRATDISADGTAHIGEDRAESEMNRSITLPPPGPSTESARLARALGMRASASSGATAFHAVDPSGMGVSCAIGLGAPFGTGKMAPAMGMLFGALDAAPADGPGAFAMMVANTNANQLHMTAYGSGGRPGLSALITSTLDHWDGGATPEVSVAAPRAHLAGGSGRLFVEQAMPAGPLQTLRSAGLQTETTSSSLGQASVFRCVKGIPLQDLRCGLGADPRSLGLSFFESN